MSPGAVVVDVGIHRLPPPADAPEGTKAKLCGDVRLRSSVRCLSLVTGAWRGGPPMTVTMLLVNTVVAWSCRHGIDHGLADLVALEWRGGGAGSMSSCIQLC